MNNYGGLIMKYKVIVLGVLLLILTSCSNNNNVTNNNIINADNIFREHDLSFIEKTADCTLYTNNYTAKIILSSDNKVYIYDHENNTYKEIQVKDLSNPPLTLCEDGIIILTYNSEIEKIFTLYSYEGDLLDTYSFKPNQHLHISHSTYINGKIITLTSLGQNENSIVALDTNTCDMKILDIENVESFIKYDNSKILIKYNNINEGIIYDIENSSIVAKIDYLLNLSSSTYDASTNQLYGLYNSSISIATLDAPRSSVAFTNNKLKNCRYLTRNNKHLFTLNGKKLISIPIDRLTSSEAFTVLLSSPEKLSYYFTGLIEDFNNDYPNININFMNIPSNSYDTTLNTKVMAKDTDFDLFYISSFHIAKYIRNNAIENLEPYSSLSNKFDDMFNGIKKLCSNENNELIAIPIGIYGTQNTFKLNSNIFNKLKIKKPTYSWSWNDFKDIAIKMKAIDNRYFMLRNSKLEFWLFCMEWIYLSTNTDNVSGKIDIDKQDFIELLELTKALYENEYILDIHTFDTSTSIDTTNEVSLLQSTSLPNHEDDFVLPTPNLNKKTAYPFRVDYFALNINSSKKDIALTFLEKCISKDAQANDNILPMPILYKDKNIYKESNYKDFISNTSNYDTYSHMMEHSTRLENYDLHQLYRDILEEYFAGKLTSEETASSIIDKINMALQE